VEETTPQQKLRDYQEKLFGPIDWEKVEVIKKNVVSISKVA
jgi:hypothetical protein